MKLWSAIAVQLLAIAFREHQRFEKQDYSVDCPAVEVVCNCTESVPSIYAEPGFCYCTGLCCGVVISLAVLSVGRVLWWGQRNGEAAAVIGRRRGGGVLS